MGRVTGGIERSRVIVDSAAHAEFCSQGYIIVDLLNAEESERLRAELEPLIPSDGGPFFSLYRNDTASLRRRIDATVREVLEPAANRLMCNHRFYIGAALVKFPETESDLDAHQDWSFVDESRFVSGLVWTALDDVDGSNGALFVVPGSHRLDRPYRGVPHQPVDDLADAPKTCPLRAGQAVIYHNALIHGSWANRSKRPRIAVGLGFVSADADLVHFQTDASGQQWRYRLADGYPFAFEPPGLPPGEVVLDVMPWDPEIN